MPFWLMSLQLFAIRKPLYSGNTRAGPVNYEKIAGRHIFDIDLIVCGELTICIY